MSDNCPSSETEKEILWVSSSEDNSRDDGNGSRDSLLENDSQQISFHFIRVDAGAANVCQ